MIISAYALGLFLAHHFLTNFGFEVVRFFPLDTRVYLTLELNKNMFVTLSRACFSFANQVTAF